LERKVLDQAKVALEKGDAKLLLSTAAFQRMPNGEKNGERLDAQFLKALESAAAGVTSLERLRFAIEEVDDQREALMGRVSSEGPLAEAIASADQSSLLRSWDSLDKDTVGYVLRSLISHVSVSDDSVELTLNSEE
jgi:phage shock protein A